MNIEKRYSNKEELRAQIWDARNRLPGSIMPPFGRNYILSEKEVDKVVEFVWTL